MSNMARHLGKLLHRFPQNYNNFNIVCSSLRQELVKDPTSLRFLYSKSSLGIDTFEQQREKTKLQLSNLEDKFKTRMKEYVGDEKNMIFTEDLKNMVHLASTNEEAELVTAMLKRFNTQNKQMRFGNFKFGPIVMRLFYLLNRPDLAMQCFQSEEYDGIFDQLITYQIYLDLLYSNQMYKEVIENFELIKKRQIEGAMYPRNSIVLVLAACYKLNNSESLDYAFNLWKKLESSGYYPARRATTFCAALALSQGKPEAALEIISNAKNQGYTTVRNLKLLILANLGRLEDCLPILKSLLELDIPGANVQTFNEDVLNKLKERFAEEDNVELVQEFNRLEELLRKQGHISKITLDEQLSSEIHSPTFGEKRQPNTNFFNQGRNFRDNRGQRQDYVRNVRTRQRPGLEDLM